MKRRISRLPLQGLSECPSNFNQIFKRETFPPDEWKALAEVVRGTYKFNFKFPDGTKI